MDQCLITDVLMSPPGPLTRALGAVWWRLWLFASACHFCSVEGAVSCILLHPPASQAVVARILGLSVLVLHRLSQCGLLNAIWVRQCCRWLKKGFFFVCWSPVGEEHGDKRWEETDNKHSSSSQPLPQKCLLVSFCFFLLLDCDAQSCCGGCSCRSVALDLRSDTGRTASGLKTQALGQLRLLGMQHFPAHFSEFKMTLEEDFAQTLTDSHSPHGFATNPWAPLIEWCVSGCTAGSKDYSKACSALNPHIADGAVWRITLPN